MRDEIKLWLRALVLTIICVPLYSLASNIGTLTSFTAGTPIQSAQVNANFGAITTAVNSKQDAIDFTCPGGQALTGFASAGSTPTCASVGGLAIGEAVTGNSAVPGLAVTNTANSAAAIWGTSNGTTEFSIGLLGEASGALGSGVLAINDTQTGYALTIGKGYFQVQGAGANTSTTAFLWTVTAASKSASSCAGNCSLIDNPMTNGNGNLLLTVTQTLTPNSIYNAHPIGVWYDGAKWEIFNEDNAAMPTNASFNVLVISP